MEFRVADEWGSVEYVVSEMEWDEMQTRIAKLEAALEKAEDNAWREAISIARGTNADLCDTARRANQVICGAINAAVNDPTLRTLQGRVKARIEKLEATILQMGENAAKNAKYYEARIEELEAAQGWQSIETAPKDGTAVFVWYPDTPKALRGEFEDRIKMGKFVAEIDEWSVQGVGGNMPPEVTHWRPLFNAPKGTNDETQTWTHLTHRTD